MSITTTRRQAGHRFLLYGAPGAGKTYLAASTRSCVYVPVEDGLLGVPWDVPHTDEPPRTYQALLEATREAAAHAQASQLRHVVLDSLTGVERLVYQQACADTGRAYSDALDYGKLWRTAKPLWSRLLAELDTVHRSGLHVWLLAHGCEETAADAETGKTWRRQTIQVEGTRDTVQETRTALVAWADHVLCLTRDVSIIRQRDAGRAVARVGDRVLWTSDALGQCVAKNRASLPDELEGSWPALSRALAAGLRREPSPVAEPQPEAPPAAPEPQPSPLAASTPPAPAQARSLADDLADEVSAGRWQPALAIALDGRAPDGRTVAGVDRASVAHAAWMCALTECEGPADVARLVADIQRHQPSLGESPALGALRDAVRAASRAA